MKKKLGLNMEISERDKKLLWILASVLIVFIGYYFGFNKLSASADNYETQLTQAHKKYDDLSAKYAKKDTYLNDTEDFKNKYNTVIANYQNGTSQDTSLVFLNDVEKITGGWIKSTAFTDVSSIYKFGAVTSTNPAKSGESVYSTDFEGYKTTLTLSYEAKYDDFKQLISFLNNYYSKVTIDSINMAYNQEDNTVSGSMVVSSYCITGSSRPFAFPEIDTQKGTNNLFYSAVFLPNIVGNKEDSNGNYILGDYDYYMLLNSASSDIDACIIGKKNDTGNTVLTSNENKMVDATVRFAGSDGIYTVQYTIDGKQFPSENYSAGSSFIPGKTLDFLVMSSKRASSDDKSGVNITFVNDTDMDLNVKVCNDDTTRSRVNITKTTGAVNVYR